MKWTLTVFFYLAKYSHNTSFQHVINIKSTEILYIFCNKSLKSNVYFTHTAHHCSDQPRFSMWLVATILNGSDLN